MRDAAIDEITALVEMYCERTCKIDDWPADATDELSDASYSVSVRYVSPADASQVVFTYTLTHATNHATTSFVVKPPPPPPAVVVVVVDVPERD